MKSKNSNGIGTLREKSLHAELKRYYQEEGDAIEEIVDGYHIDIKRGAQLIEIQTKNFSALKKKLEFLLETHPVLLVHPIAERKWIVKRNKKGETISRRKSPKRGRYEDIFTELIRIPKLASHAHLSVEILLVEIEEIWLDDGKGSWRRGKWSILDRKLLDIKGKLRLSKNRDYLGMLPNALSRPFTIKALSKELRMPINLARKMCYSLRKMGLLDIVGKVGNAHILDITATKA